MISAMPESDETLVPTERKDASSGEMPKKKADHPHAWTIGLSAAALLFSFCSLIVSWLSWSETRANRQINAATSRAFLSLSTVLVDTRFLYGHADPKFREAITYASVTNTGKVPAKNVRVSYSMMEESPGGSRSTDKKVAHYRELAPGVTEKLRFGVPVLAKGTYLDLTNGQIAVDFKVIYNDGLNKGDKLESVVMCGNKPPQPGAIVYLHYCVSDMSEQGPDGKPFQP